MMNRQKLLQALPEVERYALAVLAVVCTLAIHLVLEPMLGGRAPYLFFIVAVVIVKRLWGTGPGFLATLLGGVSAWYFILEPQFSFAIRSHADVLNLVAYFVIGAGISVLGEMSDRTPSAVQVIQRNIKRRVVRQTAVLAGAVMVLIGMVLLLDHDFKRAQTAEGWVVHTYNVIGAAEHLRRAIDDAGTGERKFLQTGDPGDLAECNTAAATTRRVLNELKDLTLDSPIQQIRWIEVKLLTDEKLSTLQQALELRKAKGADASLAFLRSTDSLDPLDKLRTTLDAIMGEERQLLIARTAQAEAEIHRGPWILGLGSGALIILLVLASMVIEREAVRREHITQILQRHAGLLEQAQDCLLICRLRGTIDYWGRGAEILYGYSHEEALGQYSHELLKTTHPLGIARINEILEREGMWQGEVTQTTRDGRKLVLEAHWTVVVDAEGNKSVLQANHDITEHKRAEAERALLATAIEQAAETVVITDREAKILYANPAFTRITGYTLDEAIGQNPRVLKSGAHDPSFYQDLWSTITAGKLWQGEFINRRKDGTLYNEEATVAPVRDSSGKITNYIAIKSDVTDRKKAERALRDSEATLRFFVKHAPAAIAMLDREMRYLVVSERWKASYRLGEGDIIGRSHYELFPEISERWKQVHQRCLAGAVESCEEDPFPRHDGNIDWIKWEVRPWRKADDSIGGIIIFSEDITERKRAQESLRESESRERARAAEIEALMEAVPVGIFKAEDAECHWMSGNRAAYDLLRRPRGSNLSKSGPESEKPVNFRALKNGKEIPLAELPMQWAAATGQAIRDHEMDFEFEDGVTVNVLGNAVPLLDESGCPRGAIAAFVDITELKHAQEALAESELRYRQLFERSESAVAVYEILFDPQGNACDYRYLHLNPAFGRITRRDPGEILGRTALQVEPKVDQYWIDLFGRVAITGEAATFEHFASNLGRCYAGTAYSPRAHQVAVNFIDVTERKQAEEALRRMNVELEARVRSRTAALEASNRELEAFARSVSHDLRAPLRGIDGWSLALLEDYGQHLDAQAQKYLGRVRSEAQRMGKLIDDLLHLSRVGRAELVPTPVDLTSLAETVAGRLREAHPERCIEFIIARQLTCTGDARLLETALTNLLENAVKFTSLRSHARVEFGKTEGNDAPVFFVRDNGVGFDMAYVGILFAPFQRLHKADEFPGTGIGLATVQRVIHRHGGRIWAESEVGKGATFYFTLGGNDV
jgi:PAS domain S-box-containing protein